MSMTTRDDALRAAEYLWQIKGDPIIEFNSEEQAAIQAGIDALRTLAAQPESGVTDEGLERACRVIASRCGEDWDRIGDFARETIREGQREAFAAALAAPQPTPKYAITEGSPRIVSPDLSDREWAAIPASEREPLVSSAAPQPKGNNE